MMFSGCVSVWIEFVQKRVVFLDLNEALIQNVNSVEAIYRRHSLLALMNELI